MYCNGDHVTIDDLLDCPPCDTFMSDIGPLYTVYALWEGIVTTDIYDGDDYDDATRAFDDYLTTAAPGESIHLYEPSTGIMLAEVTMP